jgi:hypothetical protein
MRERKKFWLLPIVLVLLHARGYAVIAQGVLAHLQEHAARYGLDGATGPGPQQLPPG